MFTHLFLYPGIVGGGCHDHLDEAGEHEDQQQGGRDVLPQVVVAAVWSEAQHVFQVFKETDE